MTETELDMASPGMQRENKSRKKSLANAELTIEVGFRVEKYDFPFFYLHRCVFNKRLLEMFYYDFLLNPI